MAQPRWEICNGSANSNGQSNGGRGHCSLIVLMLPRNIQSRSDRFQLPLKMESPLASLLLLLPCICFSSPGESLSSNSHCSGPTRTQQRHFPAESSSSIDRIRYRSLHCYNAGGHVARAVACIALGVAWVLIMGCSNTICEILRPLFIRAREGGCLSSAAEREERCNNNGWPAHRSAVMQCHKITLMRPDERNVQLSPCTW